jgi:hypothetical protein
MHACHPAVLCCVVFSATSPSVHKSCMRWGSLLTFSTSIGSIRRCGHSFTELSSRCCYSFCDRHPGAPNTASPAADNAINARFIIIALQLHMRSIALQLHLRILALVAFNNLGKAACFFRDGFDAKKIKLRCMHVCMNMYV